MSALYYGYNPPFFGGQQKVLSRQSDEILIKNDVLQILLTAPGERLFRPFFGVGLRNRLFDPSDSFDNIESDIVNQINRYDGRLDNIEVDIIKQDNTVYLFISGFYNQKAIDINLSITSGGLNV